MGSTIQHRHFGILQTVIAPILAVLTVFILDIRSFRVTPRHIRAKSGFRRLSLPIESIARCSLIDISRDPSPRGMFEIYLLDPGDSKESLRAMRDKDQDVRLLALHSVMKQFYCLQIETTNGRKYYFVLKDPEAACGIINAAIQARGVTSAS
jgi:hypothetical protein